MVPVQWIKTSNAVKVFADECKVVADSCLLQIQTLRELQSAYELQSQVKDKAIQDCVDAANAYKTEAACQSQKAKSYKQQRNWLSGGVVVLLIALLL